MLTYKCITLILRVSEIHDKLYLDQQSQAYRQLCRNPDGNLRILETKQILTKLSLALFSPSLLNYIQMD